MVLNLSLYLLRYKTISPVVNRIYFDENYVLSNSTYAKQLIDFMRTPLIKFVYDKVNIFIEINFLFMLNLI